jgi:3-hydroxyacyl-CoA dehydrogenase
MARIRRVGVVGAGVMGSGIAALVAGAGVPVLLLDIVPPDLGPDERSERAARDRFAAGGKARALGAKPAAFFTPRDAVLVDVGNLEDDLERLRSCDLLIEAVKEDLAVKQALFARLEDVRAPHAILASNTSGLPLARMTEGRSAAFRQHFLVMHFFNPPRYMKLLELVSGPATLPEVTERVQRFGEDVLGKGVVHCKDTPNFIANRIGTFGMMDAIRLMMEMDLAIEEVDAICGRPLGHPKSAIFRTTDLVGLDTVLHVAANCHRLLTGDEQREVFRAPPFLEEMVKRGMLGDKAGGGFYKKTKEGRLALDWKTLEYRPARKVRFDAIGDTKGIADPGERTRALVRHDDAAGRFAWATVSRTLNYSARRVGEIADDVVNIDRALRWGFNWDAGPFEALDALGTREVAARLRADGEDVAPLLLEMGDRRFYPGPHTFLDVPSKAERPIPVNPRALALPRTDRTRVVKENDGATLWDLGDGVLGLELHTKMNSVDADVVTLMDEAVAEAERNWLGIVIGNESPSAFSAGANLFLVLIGARNGAFDQIEQAARAFQDANLRLRASDVPVVAAAFGLALGGGAEIVMSADAVRAHCELYMGLVEVGVGLVPAGGGLKELVFRAMSGIPKGVDPFAAIQEAFRNAAMAKVSTSAEAARDMGFLAERDGVTFHRDQLLRDAKETVLGMARAGYRRPLPRSARVAGESGLANFRAGLWAMEQGHAISEHDRKVATHVARVLCGGAVPAGSLVTEQRLLDLEREAFLSLCGEPRTQERMEYMLTNNKPLRN